MKLNRDDLEREIVTYDKQKLITQCLKLFDSNVGLVNELEKMGLAAKNAAEDAIGLRAENSRLECRTVWQIWNERLSWKIEKMRKRRLSVNYPMK